MTLAVLRRGVLIDSSASLALFDIRDHNHQAAQRIQQRIISEQLRMVLTNFLLAESHALILNRLNRGAANRFLSRVDRATEQGYMTVIRVEPEDETRARDIIARYDDKDFSLTDAISFAIMERAGIPAAFTFDSDFAQYGLDVLTPGI